jgi:hypothetical protein
MSVRMFIYLYVVTQVRNKKVIKSKAINHYKNDFINERCKTNNSRNIR